MVMEQRVSKLEGAFEELSARLRSMEGHLEAMRAENARQFKEQGDRFEKLLKEQSDRFEARFDKLEAETNARFEKMQADMDARFEKMQADMTRQFKEQNDRLDNMQAESNRRFDAQTVRIDWQNRLIIAGATLIVAGLGTLVGLSFA